MPRQAAESGPGLDFAVKSRRALPVKAV